MLSHNFHLQNYSLTVYKIWNLDLHCSC